MKVREIIYRLGNKEELALYRKGKFPSVNKKNQPFKSVYFSDDIEAPFEYKQATKQGMTHSKNNKMDFLYSLLVEYDKKDTVKMCVRRKGSQCKAFFFYKTPPKIIMVHRHRVG